MIFSGFITVIILFTLATIVINVFFLSKDILRENREKALAQTNENMAVFDAYMDNLNNIQTNFLVNMYMKDEGFNQYSYFQELDKITTAANPMVSSIQIYDENQETFYGTEYGLIKGYKPEWLINYEASEYPLMYYWNHEQMKLGYLGILNEPQKKPVYFLLELQEESFKELTFNKPFVEGTIQLVINVSGDIVLETEKIDLSILSGLNEHVESVIIEGETYMVYVQTSEFRPYRFVQLVPFRELMVPIWKNIRISSLVFLLMAGVTILLAYEITKYLYTPTLKLTEYVKRYSEEDWINKEDVIIIETEAKGPKEFEVLKDGLNLLLTKVNSQFKDIKRISDLKENEQMKNITKAVNPHFQYNILNSIIWMLEESKNEEAIEVLSALGKHYRKTLDINKNFVSLKEEIEATYSYFELYNLTLENRIQLNVFCDEPLLKYKIQTLMLQPIVENAMVHAFRNSEKTLDKRITISILKLDEKIRIVVEDNGCGMKGELVKQLNDDLKDDINNMKTYGLWNVHKRCKLMYGEHYGLYVESVKDVFTKITLDIKSMTEQES